MGKNDQEIRKSRPGIDELKISISEIKGYYPKRLVPGEIRHGVPTEI